MNVRAENGIGWAPIYTAVTANQSAALLVSKAQAIFNSIIELLLQRGADPNTTDRCGFRYPFFFISTILLHCTEEKGQQFAPLCSNGRLLTMLESAA